MYHMHQMLRCTYESPCVCEKIAQHLNVSRTARTCYSGNNKVYATFAAPTLTHSSWVENMVTGTQQRQPAIIVASLHRSPQHFEIKTNGREKFSVIIISSNSSSPPSTYSREAGACAGCARRIAGHLCLPTSILPRLLRQGGLRVDSSLNCNSSCHSQRRACVSAA